LDAKHSARIAAEPVSLPRVFGERQGNGHGNGRRTAAANARRGDLEPYFRQALLDALELSPASLDKIWSPEIAAEAVAAAAALKRQARTNPALGNELRLAESDNQRVLEEARDLIAEQYADDRRAIELLNDLVAQIGSRVPALMLLPEGGLIDRLVSALEQAYGGNGLNEHEHALLSRLNKLKGDIKLMNLSDASSWKRLSRQFEHLNDPGVSSSPSPPDGSKLH
jgi:hypothetical protein